MGKLIESKIRIKNINPTIQVDATDKKKDEIVSRLANKLKNITDLINKSNGKGIHNRIKCNGDKTGDLEELQKFTRPS